MADSRAQALAELLGRDNPAVRSLDWAKHDPTMRSAAEQMRENMVRQAGWDPNDLPKFKLPRDISASDYSIGTAVSGSVMGQEIGLSEEDLSSHIGVFGMTSTGKTVLVQLLIVAFMQNAPRSLAGKRTFLIWDLHSEYRCLMSLFRPGHVVWLCADEIGVNPLQLPLGLDGKPVMPPERWIGQLREWLRLSWLNEPSLNVFCELLLEEYRKRGVLSGESTDYPSISDLIDVLERLDAPRGSDRARARDKVLDRLKSVRHQLPGLDVEQSRDLNKLFREHSVILDVSTVRDLAYQALFALLRIIRRELLWSEDTSGCDHMEVMEEAHENLGGHVDRRTSDLKEGTASATLRDLRKTRTCGVAVSQLVPDLNRSIRGNLGTVFCLRQGDRACVDAAAAALNLAPWQKPELARLMKRHAVAKFSRYGDPVHLIIKDAAKMLGTTHSLTRDEARQLSEPILRGIPYVKRAKRTHAPATERQGRQVPKKRGGLSEAEFRVFARRVNIPWELTCDTLQALALNRDAYGRIKKNIDARGLLQNVGTVGAKYRLDGPTERGVELARQLGLPVGVPRKGDFAHECLISYCERLLKEYFEQKRSGTPRMLRAGVSATMRNRQPDLTVIPPSGNRFAMQACNRNEVAYEVTVLLELHQLALLDASHADALDFVLAVCVNKRHRASIKEAVRDANGGLMPPRMMLLDFDSMLKVNWDDLFESVH